jgi:hypothetical protein
MIFYNNKCVQQSTQAKKNRPILGCASSGCRGKDLRAGVFVIRPGIRCMSKTLNGHFITDSGWGFEITTLSRIVSNCMCLHLRVNLTNRTQLLYIVVIPYPGFVVCTQKMVQQTVYIRLSGCKNAAPSSLVELLWYSHASTLDRTVWCMAASGVCILPLPSQVVNTDYE